MKKIIALASLSLIIFSGCKKEDSCNLTQESIVGTFRLTGLTYQAYPSATPVDQYYSLNDCVKDDVFIFNADGTFAYEDAGVHCFPPVNESSTWSLSGTTLVFDGSVNEVTEFDCSNMTTVYYDPQGGALTARYIRQ